MWQYRELIKILTITDLKNRYQNTVLGFFWTILSPLALTLVLYFIFRFIFRQEENYAANLLIGIASFRFFAVATGSALSTIVGKSNLVTKVYLPRQILILSNGLANLIGSFLEFIIIIPILFALLGKLPLTILLFPIIHIFYFLLIYGIGLLLSSLYVYFRDLNFIWEVLTNLFFYCTPIIYPLSVVPASLMPYYMLNPITQVITIYRSIMITGTMPPVDIVIYFAAFIFGACLLGSLVFAKLQRRFAEAI